MIKRTAIFLTVLLAAVSCFDKANFSQSSTVVASFELANLSYDDYFGSDSLYYDIQYKIGVAWEPLAFCHKVDNQTDEFQGGFMLSYLAIPESGVTEGLANNKYRVNSKNNKSARNTYLVYSQTPNMPENDMVFTLASTEGATTSCVMSKCFVNNTVAVAEAVKAQFVPGDKLLLKASGYLAKEPTGSAEVVLAEKTTSKDSIVSTWTAFDLSALGSVDKVDFEIVVPEGKYIPEIVCIDNVIADVSISY